MDFQTLGAHIQSILPCEKKKVGGSEEIHIWETNSVSFDAQLFIQTDDTHKLHVSY